MPQKTILKRPETGRKAVRETKAELTARIDRILSALDREYGTQYRCYLNHETPWQLLIAVIMSAQCTDARVNVVVEKLYEKFPDVDALAQAPVEEIERIVHPCGLGNSKARDISACMKMLRDEYGGKVPDDFNKLLALPGVGRKSANLIMGDVFGKPAIVTDTHCIRLVNRMGLVDGSAIAALSTERKFVGAIKIGDTIHREVEVLEAKQSKSKPDRGVLNIQYTILNQDNQVCQVGSMATMLYWAPPEEKE